MENSRSNETHHTYAYLFEAKGIQRYVFDSGFLRDIIGASDLVAELAATPDGDVGDPDAGDDDRDVEDDLIGKVIAAAGLQGAIRFSRRSGGAFCLHGDDKAALERIRSLLRLAVSLHCPGLEYSDSGPVGGATDVEALSAAYRAGGAVRHNSAAEIPPTGHPLTAFNRRTGRVLTGLYLYRKREQIDYHPVDVLSGAQRQRAARIRSDQNAGNHDRVARRFLPSVALEDPSRVVFPRNMEAEDDETAGNPSFPFAGRDRRIAVVHADLSGLGQIFRAVTDSANTSGAEEVLAVASTIEELIEASARAATEKILLGASASRTFDDGEVVIIPARPVLLGGDDITILVRADLALDYAEELLLKIEETSKAPFGKLHARYGTPEHLSACAGVAIVNAGQPFLMAHDLAADLCSFAKKFAKRARTDDASADQMRPYPSLIAFHNSQSTISEDYGAILDRELTPCRAANGQPEIRLTGNPYLVGHDQDPAQGRPKLADLKALARSLVVGRRGRGKLVDAGRLLFGNLPAARRAFSRWATVLKADEPEGFARTETALHALGLAPQQLELLMAESPGPNEAGDAAVRSAFATAMGPIGDALELIDLAALGSMPAHDDRGGDAS